MDVCAASVVDGSGWRATVGTFALCQDRTQR